MNTYSIATFAADMIQRANDTRVKAAALKPFKGVVVTLTNGYVDEAGAGSFLVPVHDAEGVPVSSDWMFGYYTGIMRTVVQGATP